MLNERNEPMRGIVHSKCNKDIRIGVTSACKEFGMKITGRGSIAGCESSNLIDIPIICDVLQAVGLFEDTSFPNPSDKVDKAERAERKAAKKAALLETRDQATRDEITVKDEISVKNGDDSTSNSSDMKGKLVIKSPSAATVKMEAGSTKSKTSSDSPVSIPSTLGTDEASLASQDTDKQSDQKYAPNMINIESVLTERWENQLQYYLTDMQKRKTPYHYHAADGISAEGVAMVASYIPTPTPTPKATPKGTPKIPKISSKARSNATSDDENESGDCGKGVKSESGDNNSDIDHQDNNTSSSTDVITTSKSNDDMDNKKGDRVGAESSEVVVDTITDTGRRKHSLSVVTNPDEATKSPKVSECSEVPLSDTVDDGDMELEKNVNLSPAAKTSQLSAKRRIPSRHSIKKNKSIKATKSMMKSVDPFEPSVTPRQTPLSACSSAGASRRPLDKFRASNGLGEQLNLLDSGDVSIEECVPDDKGEKMGNSVGKNMQTCLESGDTKTIEESSKKNDVNDKKTTKKSGGKVKKGETKEKPKKVPKEKKEKEKKVKKEKKIKLKDINTDHAGCDTSGKLSSTSNKKGKRKDLLVVISPATGGTLATPPVLPPRIGSGGVGGTTTGYSIAHALLKPSLSKDEAAADTTPAEQYNGTQEMFLNPAGALKAWSEACYDEGLALGEEERLLRYIAGQCELSLPNPAFRIGTRYLDSNFEYVDEINRLKVLSGKLDEKEDVELVQREALVQAQGLEEVVTEESRGPVKRRRMSVGSGGGGGHGRRKDRTQAAEVDPPTAMDESPMMHSAVALDSTEGCFYDQVEGQDFDRVTDPNVALTASMLWQRAQANAVYNPPSTLQGNSDGKSRSKREKKDFFETYLSDSGGHAIAGVVSTTLASVAGIKNIQAGDDDVSKVVLDQVDKMKKGSRNSVISIAKLHPGALDALDLHGVVSGPTALMSQTSGGFKRQRSLSNIQAQQGSTAAPIDTRSSYLADTIGGYPTKNTVPHMTVAPSIFAPAVKQSTGFIKKSKEKLEPSSGDNTKPLIHTCPLTGRISLPDLTVYSVKMPWKLLAREFEIFDPSAMEKESRYPRTPTSLPPTSPRFPISSATSTTSLESCGGETTTSNLNGPMGIWVSTGDTETKPDTPVAGGLRITAPHHSTGLTQVRRRRKRNSEGVLMDLDSRQESPRSASTQGSMSAQGPREFRRIAFSDVVAPSFRLLEEGESGADDETKGNVSDDDDEEEDISDEAILKRHEATLTSMRDRWKAIQDLKSSLKKSSGGDSETGPVSGSGGHHATSNIIHAHNKRRKAGGRPATPKNGTKKGTGSHAISSSSSPKIPKYVIVDGGVSEKGITSKVVKRQSKSPTVIDQGAPQPRKRGRPMKLSE